MLRSDGGQFFQTLNVTPRISAVSSSYIEPGAVRVAVTSAMDGTDIAATLPNSHGRRPIRTSFPLDAVLAHSTP
ncbi:MAG: hypothetical protein NVS3B12_23780 [Acidimicrobiales bacterium]